MRTKFDERIPLRDGVEVSADVYLPDSTDPVAIVLARTPYNKNDAFSASKAASYVEAGYGFVWVDVRGRGDSDGELAPYRQEGKDGYDVVEWIAEQSWCDENVITWGQSYLGAIQLLTAIEHPPHLRAMVVYVTPSDPFIDWPTGVHLPIEISWYRLIQRRLLQNTSATDWNRVYEHLPLITMDTAAGFSSPRWQEDLHRGPSDTEYWEEMSFQHRLDTVDIPALHVTGWYDDVQPGGIRNFAILSEEAPSPETRASQRLVVGPWDHELTRDRNQRLGDIDFGPDSHFDLDSFELAWLDHYVRGVDNGADREARVQYFSMGANTWETSECWPPKNQRLSLYLNHTAAANTRHGGGKLDLTAPKTATHDQFRYDPNDPVPFLTGETSAQIGGPDDYREVEDRQDVLSYTSDVIEDELTVAGQITVTLTVSTDGPDTDFTAMLLDVHPDGYAQRLCDGIARLRYRDGVETEKFVSPGEKVTVTIDLWNTGQVFRKGHKIRLDISSSAFPKYDRSLNTSEPIATRTEMRVAENTVWIGEEFGSRLELPVTEKPNHNDSPAKKVHN